MIIDFNIKNFLGHPSDYIYDILIEIIDDDLGSKEINIMFPSIGMSTETVIVASALAVMKMYSKKEDSIPANLAKLISIISNKFNFLNVSVITSCLNKHIKNYSNYSNQIEYLLLFI